MLTPRQKILVLRVYEDVYVAPVMNPRYPGLPIALSLIRAGLELDDVPQEDWIKVVGKHVARLL